MMKFYWRTADACCNMVLRSDDFRNQHNKRDIGENRYPFLYAVFLAAHISLVSLARQERAI